MTIENLSGSRAAIYQQVNCELGDVADDAAYFHAQFRRSNPLPCKSEHIILDQAHRTGHVRDFLGSGNFWVNDTYQAFRFGVYR
jgi:Protein of unknown function (DUF2961)